MIEIPLLGLPKGIEQVLLERGVNTRGMSLWGSSSKSKQQVEEEEETTMSGDEEEEMEEDEVRTRPSILVVNITSTNNYY
jgi:hypothetical protein